MLCCMHREPTENSSLTSHRPGVDSRRGEQEAAETAVCVASTFTFRVTLREGFNNLHKGFWENTRLIVYCTLKREKEQEEEDYKEEEADDQKTSEQTN